MKLNSQVVGLRLLLAVAGVAVAALLVVLPLLAVHIDRSSAALERGLVEAAIRRESGAILSRLDDAARRADVAPAGTVPFRLDYRQDAAYIIDAYGRVAASEIRGGPIAQVSSTDIQSAVAPLLIRLRSDYFSGHLANSSALAEGFATVVIKGRAYGMLAALIPTRMTHHPSPSALIALIDFTGRVIPALREDLQQANARIVVGAIPPRGEFLTLQGPEGRPAAFLAWEPYAPASRLLAQAGMPILIGVTGLAIALVVSYRQGRSSAAALVDSERRANHLAFHDQLTELANRRYLLERLAQELARVERHGGFVAVLLIDLDRFKFINDTYGHQCGDELLKEVSRRLTQAARAEDVVARLGGDEFVILASPCGASDAAAIAQRVLSLLAKPVHLGAVTVRTGGSVGVAVHLGGPLAPADLLRQADLALYRVKEQGRNNFQFFETEMDQALQVRRGLEADLRAALRSGEIGVVYQPQFHNGEIVGVEALARWIRPEGGAIDPAIFIPLAEECGFMEELGRHIIGRVFDDSSRWYRLRVAINLSSIQLRNPSFLSNLQLLVEYSGVEPKRFEFEVTENVLLADDVQTQQTLASLRDMGFGLALDGFGTSYSSLGHLRRFPVNRIKIDRSFVAGLGEDKVSDAVVHAVVRLGQALDMDVIAGGVETLEQQRRLSAMGCRSVQGFFTGCPVGADGILEPLPRVV